MQNTKQISEPSQCDQAKYEYKKTSYTEIYKVLQTLRQDEALCDIKLETDDGGVIFGHKVVLASASPYFLAMFTNFLEKDQDLVAIRQLDSGALHLLIDFIYSGKISITETNILLPASNLLQLQEVKNACCDFLQAQLCPTNVIGIIALADLHSCTKLLTSSELYFQQHFSDVVEGDEFLSLSSEQIVKLIASDELIAPSEEKIFESVIQWVEHDLDSRKQILPQLMEHVRLPLTSKDYILKNVVDEPLLNNCFKCKDYILEALRFHLLKSEEIITIPHNIRTKPRQPGGTHKVILVVGGSGTDLFHDVLDSTEWYDPKNNQWQTGPKMITPRYAVRLAVVNDNFVLCLGGRNSESTLQSVDGIDLYSDSPHWRPTYDMLSKRWGFAVGVINNYIFVVGGHAEYSFLNSAEVFNCRTQEWHTISNMSTKRAGHGLGVLNNLLYAVGGFDSEHELNSVECYHPSLNKWTPITDMCVRRSAVGVGVLNGIIYAVGGWDGHQVWSSVEAYSPSTGVWSTIPDMHLSRRGAGVAVLGGLLYVVGGQDRASVLDSVEYYNPKTNTWTMITASMNVARSFAGAVAIDVPRYFKTC
ncbi:kelch-like protein 2 isoform X2 [Acyrthosiphon pisum]|uniref:Kelch-like protein diablo n=1 Tax=Acyrthosiphon pisum TaxID=7029 RepID=A0A8R2H620_ACYPI|nr:kelch-like protein 2 isoform X2 [Acyrthosiphon pisum]|eukprot:XP_016659045.1 PREDICTED: kelch-like protein 2 isoform X2 [Acyrthosiphon pisum]